VEVNMASTSNFLFFYFVLLTLRVLFVVFINDLAEVGFAEIVLTEVDLAETDLVDVVLAVAGLLHVALAEADLAETDLVEVLTVVSARVCFRLFPP
jgi:hypothetical protein